MTPDAIEPGATFYGRGAELRALNAALERARAGRGRLVAVSGDAGIGKTRLIEELTRSAGLPSNRILWGRCSEQSGAPSYWPWSRVLRTYAAARGLDRLREDLGAEATYLSALVPGLVADSSGAVTAGDLGARYLLCEAVIGLLRRIAADEPMVIVLEDAHWADEASLALLELVALELDGTRLLLVVTYRDRERPRLPRPLVEAARRGQRIVLQGLDREVVAAIASQAAQAPLSSAWVDRLAVATGGNPFFLGEVLRALAQEGRLDPARSPDAPLILPDTVRDSIRRHLEPLASEDRDVLALAAVVGEEFDLPVLELASGKNAPLLLQRLQAAVEAGLVVEGTAGRFRFAHALVRETLYGDLRPALRVHLHAHVGDALERRHGDGESATLGALASHFLHAAPLGTAAKAAAYATQAAEQALAVHAHHDALSLYEQALAAVGAAPVDRAQRLGLRLAAASAAQRAGHEPRARELLLEAAQDARALGDANSLFFAAIGYYLLRPNIAEPDPQTVPLLEEALRAIGEDESPARATLLALLAPARYSLDASPEHDALSREAVEVARRLDDPTVLATTLLARQLVVVGPGSTRERLALANEALGLTEKGAGDLEHLARAARTQCFLELGEVAAATAEIERMGLSAERLRQPDRRWQVGVRRASIALLEGRFDDAARLAAESLAVRRSASDPMALQVFVLQMFLARRDTGQHGGLEGSLRWMADHYATTQAWRCVLAVFYADLGREAEARALFEEQAADGFARLRQYQNYPAALAWIARACTFLWDVPRAAQLYPLLLPYADQSIVLGANSQACLGSTHRYLALLAATLSRVDEAEAHFRAAIAMNERMGARPVLACCQHEYARLLQHRNAPGDRATARDLIERARATSNACGMTQLLDWIERLGPIPEEGAEATAAESTLETAAPAQTASASSPSTPAPRSAAAPRASTPSHAVLRRDGDVWQVGFGDELRRMKDAKGVHLLALLLEHPGQEIHVLDLAAGSLGATAGEATVDRGDAGPLLDPSARQAYKSRLEDLRDELEEALRFNDPARADRARHEIDFLADELARGVGLGGRERRAAAASERARINATRTIAAAVKKIGELSPRLGEHLRATVRTGYLCVYAPDKAGAIRWEL
jgi:tetratricopeptide (TPR) repeat protein